jgi:hypothetical protein
LTLIILRDDHLPSAYPIVGVRPVTPSSPGGANGKNETDDSVAPHAHVTAWDIGEIDPGEHVVGHPHRPEFDICTYRMRRRSEQAASTSSRRTTWVRMPAWSITFAPQLFCTSIAMPIAAMTPLSEPRLLILDPLMHLHRVNEDVSAEVASLLAARPRRCRHCTGSSEFHAWGDSNFYCTAS